MNKVSRGLELLNGKVSKKARHSAWILAFSLMGCQPPGPAITPSPSPSLSASPSASPSASATPQPSPSATSSASVTPSASPTPAETASPSPSPTPTATPTPAPTATPQPSQSPLSFFNVKVIAGKDPNTGKIESGLRADALAVAPTVPSIAVDTASNVWFMNESNQILGYVSAEIVRDANISNGELKYRLYWERAKNLDGRGGMIFDAKSGDFYLVQTNQHRVVRINAATGVVTPVAGTGRQGYNGDGQALSTQFDQPSDIARDNEGNFYITDTGNHLVRKLTADGRIVTIAGQYTLDTKLVDTDNDGSLTDESPSLQPIGETTGDGGAARNARVKSPRSIASDASGTVYFTSDSNTIRRISKDIISRYAGSGVKGYNGSAFRADLVHLNTPNHLVVGPDGLLYFSDEFRIRRTRPENNELIVEDIAGAGRAGELINNDIAPLKAEMQPGPLDFDRNGNLYLYDIAHRRIRMIERKN